jgi:hypothetical protein
MFAFTPYLPLFLGVSNRDTEEELCMHLNGCSTEERDRRRRRMRNTLLVEQTKQTFGDPDEFKNP